MHLPSPKYSRHGSIKGRQSAASSSGLAGRTALPNSKAASGIISHLNFTVTFGHPAQCPSMAVDVGTNLSHAIAIAAVTDRAAGVNQHDTCLGDLSDKCGDIGDLRAVGTDLE